MKKRQETLDFRYWILVQNPKLIANGLQYFLVLLLMSYGQSGAGQTLSTDKNAISASKFRVASTNLADASDPTKAMTTIQYKDGLGRDMQNVGFQQTPNRKDLVSSGIDYDAFGRPYIQYLTIPNTNNTGQFQSNLANSGQIFYGDTKAFSEITAFDNSPLNRPRQNFGAGEAWRTSNKKIQVFDELAGTDVVIYTLNSSNDLVYSSTYPANSLYKKRVIDEQGNTKIEITDKSGRVIQKRQQDDSGTLPSDYITTHYVYDDWGRLRAIIQPEGYKQIVISGGNATILYNSTEFNNWVFFYNYDYRGRVIESKVPNGGWKYFVYDKSDRIVLEQNAQQATQNKWNFTKYDVFGRVAIKGELSNSNSRATLQGLFDGVATPYETWTGYTYTSQSFPISYGANDEKQWFFYDGYNWTASDWNFNASIAYDSGNYWSNATGLPTGSWARNLDDPTMLFYTVMHYDNKGRVMQTYQTHHRGGSQNWQKPIITNFQYNFAGEILATKITYQLDGQSTITTITNQEFDHTGRLLKVYHGINGTNPVEILRMTYDEIGRLSQKKIMPNGTYYAGGGSDYIIRPSQNGAVSQNNTQDMARKAVILQPTTDIKAITFNSYLAQINPNLANGTAIVGLQTIDYTWHIRGGLRGINLDASLNPMPNSSQGDLFAYKLDYETAGFYDGNIGKQSWNNFNIISNSNLGIRSYTYSYDGSSRLKSANYVGINGEDFSLPNINYDKNGNIKNMQRKGKNGTSFGFIDILGYTYNGNQVQSVSDNISGNEDVGDFRDVNNGSADYTYYPDGSLKSDANKGITLISYDTFLKKVKQVDFTGNRWVKWFYDGSGTLYKRTNSAGDVWEYLPNGLIYKNGSPYSVNVPDGRAVYVAGQWVYEFEYRDHQNNLRVAFKADGNQLVQTQANETDPFGLSIKPLSITGVSPQNFRFQNQEKIEDFGLNWNFYKYRFEDAQVGRFWQVDPLAEKYQHNSVYAFSENRLIDGVELEGLEVVLLKNTKKNEPVLKAAQSGLYADNPNTKTIHVFAHGNPKAFYNDTMKGDGTVDTGADLNNVLNQGSSLWKNSKSKEGFTIVLHACRTGKCVVDKNGNITQPVASKISESTEMAGVTIVAPDERDGFTAGGKEIGPQVTENTDKNGEYLPGTPSNEHGKQTSEYGHWNSYQNGKMTKQQSGNIKPEGKDQRNLWDRLFN